MHVVDLIELKREGNRLPKASIYQLFQNYLAERVPPYQISALLMAIFFQGMEDEELVEWTQAMMESGDVMDFSHLEGSKVDKHSTGGVGDKISLPLAPLLAACGLYVPMISGRGLGHTGGTLDKLESIQGFNTQQSATQFEALLKEVRVGMIGQTEHIVPIDKRLYALRDVTGTVPSIPLIASSIMSKKLAEGTEHLVLDVKVGLGAFMRTIEDGRILADACIKLGHGMGRNVRVLLTQMDQPIGHMIGNALEVKESVEVLRGEGPADTRMLTLALAEELLDMTGLNPHLATQKLDSGEALECFYHMVAAQGGDVSMVKDLTRLPQASKRTPLLAPQSGWVHLADARKMGDACVLLGAGRRVAADSINPSVGVEVVAKVGDRVEKGAPLLWIEHDDKGLEEAQIKLLDAYSIQEVESHPPARIYERRGHSGGAEYHSLLS